MDLIDIAIWAFIVFSILQVVKVIISYVAYKDVEVAVKEHLNKIIHEVKVEKHQGIEYWFDNETDQFLGQGKTVEEIANSLKSRFPDHIFVLPLKGVMCAPTWTISDKIDIASRKKHYGVE